MNWYWKKSPSRTRLKTKTPHLSVVSHPPAPACSLRPSPKRTFPFPTLAWSSISASDSSSQRSKSGARNRGFFSCSVSRSHQRSCCFLILMSTWRWVDRWLIWKTGKGTVSQVFPSNLNYFILFPNQMIQTSGLTGSRNSRLNLYSFSPLAPWPWAVKPHENLCLIHEEIVLIFYNLFIIRNHLWSDYH